MRSPVPYTTHPTSRIGALLPAALRIGFASRVDECELLIPAPPQRPPHFHIAAHPRYLPSSAYAASLPPPYPTSRLTPAVAQRTGQGGWRLNGNVRGLARATGTGRDDDRFWKVGLLYVNRDDPALVVGSHIGAGWTLNLGNPAAWLLIAGNVAALAALVAIGAVAGT